MEKVCLLCHKEFDENINFCLECGSALQTAGTPTEKIVNCDFEYKCPLDWNKLEKTGDEDVRFCHSCEKNVYFAHLQHQLDDLARQNKCVAFQPSRNIKFFGNFQPPPLMGVVVSPERMAEFEKKKKESEQTPENTFTPPDKPKSWWQFWK